METLFIKNVKLEFKNTFDEQVQRHYQNGCKKELPEFATVGVPSPVQDERIEILQIPLELYFQEDSEEVPDRSQPQFLHSVVKTKGESSSNE